MFKCERVNEMCRHFQRYQGNERAKISFCISRERNVTVYAVFDFLKDWHNHKGAYILRQLLQQFKLDMVGYDPNNIFISEKYFLDEHGDRRRVVTYCIPFKCR